MWTLRVGAASCLNNLEISLPTLTDNSPKTPTKIRRLTPADASAYRAIMLEAYERHPEAFTSSVAERESLPLAWWESRLLGDPHADSTVLGAFRDDRLVGAVGILFDTREEARHKSTLFGMYVPDEFRRTGIGQQLVVAAMEQARARGGIKVMQLTVTEGNKTAQSLYERCGFISFGVEPFAVAVGSGYVSKVHMWCDLTRLVP